MVTFPSERNHNSLPPLPPSHYSSNPSNRSTRLIILSRVHGQVIIKIGRWCLGSGVLQNRDSISIISNYETELWIIWLWKLPLKFTSSSLPLPNALLASVLRLKREKREKGGRGDGRGTVPSRETIRSKVSTGRKGRKEEEEVGGKGARHHGWTCWLRRADNTRRRKVLTQKEGGDSRQVVSSFLRFLKFLFEARKSARPG